MTHSNETQGERFEEHLKANQEAAERGAEYLEEHPEVVEARPILTVNRLRYRVLFRYNHIPDSFEEDYDLELVDAWASKAPPDWLRRLVSTRTLVRWGVGQTTVVAEFVRVPGG